MSSARDRVMGPWSLPRAGEGDSETTKRNLGANQHFGWSVQQVGRAG